MTVAEKILRAKADYGEVHKAGKNVGYTEGYDKGHKAGYDSGYKDGTEAGGYDSGYEKGYEEGSKLVDRTLYGAYILNDDISYEVLDSLNYCEYDFIDKSVYAHFYDGAQYVYQPIVRIMCPGYGYAPYFYNSLEGEYLAISFASDGWLTETGYWDEEYGGAYSLDWYGFPDLQGRIIVFTEPLVVPQEIYDIFKQITDNETTDFIMDGLTATPNVLYKGYTAMGVGGKITGTAPTYTEAVNIGKNSAMSTFWRTQQNAGKRTNYYYAYYGEGWTDETFAPQYDLKVSDGRYMFAYSAIKNLETALQGKKIILNTASPFSMFDSGKFVVIGGISATVNISNMNGMFANCTSLEEINWTIPIASSCLFTNHPFKNCKALREVRFSGQLNTSGLDLQWCIKLSKESWISVINLLSTTASGGTMTGSLVSVNKAFETSLGANDGSTSEEWLNLIATKDNWSIILK